MVEYLQVGAVASVHGVHGEVKVFPMTDDVNRFKKLKEVIIDTGRLRQNFAIMSVKFFKNMVILKFEGIDTPEEARKYQGAALYIDRKNAVKLSKDEYFIADLIDMSVIDEDMNVSGTIRDVISTGANDVYDIELSDGRNLLLPAIHECVMSVDMEEGLMKIHILDGLLD